MSIPRYGSTCAWLAAWAAALFCSASYSHAQATSAPPRELATVAESSGYQATSNSAQVQSFLERCARRADHVRLWEMGRTMENRPITAAVVARPAVKKPSDLQEDSRVVVFILGNIHSGECAGKEALLALLRELTLDADHRWLKSCVLVIVPNYNADGNDRVGPNHRPGQNGPEHGMGLRENAQGLDLNRDFIKLESPEGRSLVAALSAWNPHLFIDTHTTNGSHHRYLLTYDVPHNPAAPASIRAYLRNKMMPAITRKLDQQGIPTFYYGNFDRDHRRWNTYGNEGRYSTEYAGLRGRLSILSEAYSYADYQDRIRATREFVTACVDHLADNADAVRKLVGSVTTSIPENVPLRSKVVAFDDKVVVKGFDPKDPEHKTPKDFTVEFWGKFEPELTVTRPYAYLLPFDCSRVADRLRMHGVRLERLTEDATIDVEIYTAKKLTRAARPFQGHAMITAEVDIATEQRTVPAGSYVVRTNQPLGVLITYLLEPQSEDGLTTWNFFDDRWDRGDEYPVLRVPAEVELRTEQVTVIPPAERLNLDKIYGPKYRISFGARPMFPSWMPEGHTYKVARHGRSYTVDAETGAYTRVTGPDVKQIVAAVGKLTGVEPKDASRLADQIAKKLPSTKPVMVTHHNDILVYFSDRNEAKWLTGTSESEELPEMSPDGRWIAFVRNDDLYVVDMSGRERLLAGSQSPQILTGKLDWVYQEELYGRGNYKAFWWSPDSRSIAFLQLDESPVHRYTVTDHIPVRQTHEITPYPKAGDPLPKVKLGIVDAAGGTIRWADLYNYSLEDLLISRVDWAPDSKQVLAQLQDRAQTWLDLCAIDRSSGALSRLFRETTKAWVSVLGPPYWLKDGSFLWLSERSGNQHLYHYDGNGKLLRAVTSGDWSVQRLYGVDGKQQWVYFSGFRENNIQAHGYRVALTGGDPERLTSDAGSHSLRFSPDFEYFVDIASGVHRPMSVTLYKTGGPRVREISPYVDDRLRYFSLHEPEFLQVRAKDGEPLDAMLIRPPDFDPARKYPVLIHVYSGPQAPTVRDAWRGSTYLWHQMLAQEGYCIWMCDNRSASMRGAKAAWPIHEDLGKHELEDIEAGIDWLKKQSWVDADRIGIWGWSYGGYMTAYALTHSQSFRMGISGAPVTDWRNYDAIYTERYMGLPQTNEKGYQSSSVVKAAKNLHGELLLIHGTQDDNVHISNTLQLALELQKANKPFSLMVYPKNRHGIVRPGQSRHLRELMTRFIREKL